jgi:hypothetical protein
MLDIMGHVSTAMLWQYSHIRAQARREAIEALESRQASAAGPKDSPQGDWFFAIKVGRNSSSGRVAQVDRAPAF